MTDCGQPRQRASEERQTGRMSAACQADQADQEASGTLSIHTGNSPSTGVSLSLESRHLLRQTQAHRFVSNFISSAIKCGIIILLHRIVVHKTYIKCLALSLTGWDYNKW